MTPKFPNFFIIGAAKAGTSSLYYYLKQHPDVFMSPIKEPHYFSYGGVYPDSKGPGDTANQAIIDYDEYVALFSAVNQERAIGEASSTYIYIEGTAERLYQFAPKAKLIATLRNPVDRAFSAYMHLVRDGRETEMSFRKALMLQEKRQASNWGPLWQYTRASFYASAISRFQALFSPEQFHIIIHDDLQRDELNVVQRTFAFLEVDSAFQPDTSFRVNVSGNKKSDLADHFITRLFDRPNLVKTASQKFIPDKIRVKFTSTLRNANLQKTEVEASLRHELTQLFRDDILRLQELIQRDLSHWLK